MSCDDCLVIFIGHIFEFTLLTRVIGTTLHCRVLMKLVSLADEVRQVVHQPFDQQLDCLEIS